MHSQGAGEEAVAGRAWCYAASIAWRFQLLLVGGGVRRVRLEAYRLSAGRGAAVPWPDGSAEADGPTLRP